MKGSSTFRRFFAFSAIVVNCWAIFTVPHVALAEEKSSDEVLYYGFFYDEDVANSLKIAADLYLNKTFENFPSFKTFLENISESSEIKNPFEYYVKPLDPNTQEYDPLYHTTAKYCGNSETKKQECDEYQSEYSDILNNKTFQMELIGFVLTNKTFGIRVNLTEEQLPFFDKEEVAKNKAQVVSPTITETCLSSDLNDICLKAQPLPLIPMSGPETDTKAHITLGCGPNVPAVITGPDMLQAIAFESEFDKFNKNIMEMTDPLIKKQDNGDDNNDKMRVIEYKKTEDADISENVYVIYPGVKIVANATLKPYYTSGESSFSSIINAMQGTTLSLLVILYSTLFA